MAAHTPLGTDCWRELSESKEKGSNYRALGSTKMKDLLKNYIVGDRCSLLLLDAGNIQNVITTVAAMHRQYPVEELKNKSLNVSICDHDQKVIARNIVLLELITRLDATKQEDMIFLWSVWFNVELSQAHYKRLGHILKHLAASTDLSSTFWILPQAKCRDTVNLIFRLWASYNYDVSKIKSSREAVYVEYDEETFFLMSQMLQWTELDKMCDNVKRGSMHPSESPELEQKSKINSTMMCPGKEVWTQYFATSPLVAFAPLNCAPPLTTEDTLVDLCFKVFTRDIKDLQEALQHLKLKISIYHGNSLNLCQEQLSSEHFDVIDTGSLVDRVGLSTVLVVCRDRLISENAILRTSSTKWGYVSCSAEEFLTKSLGCHTMMLSTLFGLRLVEDFDFGSSYYHSPQHALGTGCDEEEFHFMPALGKQNPPLTLTDHDNILEFIEHQMKLCMPWRASVDGSEVFLSDTAKRSPAPQCLTTLLLLVHRLQDSIAGGAAALVEYVASVMDQNKWMEHYKLAWRSLSSAYGYDKICQNVCEVQLPGSCFLQRVVSYPGCDVSDISALVISAEVDQETLDADIALGYETNKNVCHIFPAFHFTADKKNVIVIMLEDELTQIQTKAIYHMIHARRVFIRKELKTITYEKKAHKTSMTSAVITNSFTSQQQVVKTPDPTELKVTVIEHENHYDVRMNLLNQGYAFSVQPEFEPTTSPTRLTLTVHISHLDQSHKERLSFSCPLSVGQSRIQHSKKQGLIILNARKSTTEHSQDALTKPPLKLANHPRLQTNLASVDVLKYLTGYIFRLETETDICVTHSRLMLFRFMEVLKLIPGMQVLEFVCKKGDSAAIALHLLDSHVHDGLPLYTVRVIIPDAAEKLISEGKVSWVAVMQFRQLTEPNSGNLICQTTVGHGLPGLPLLKKLLYKNSHRVDQDGSLGYGTSEDNSWHYKSFFQIAFNRRVGVRESPEEDTSVPVMSLFLMASQFRMGFPFSQFI